jgi:DNA invertase Pin-like site-specific DNA recombinase
MIAKAPRYQLELSAKEIEMLSQLSVSRTEPQARVTRAEILLAYNQGEPKSAIARRIGVSRPTIDLCVRKALAPELMLPFET